MFLATRKPSISEMTGDSTSHMSSTTTKICAYGLQADFLTSMTDDNPTRRFYRCKLRKTDDCGYFDWFDDDLPPFQKSCFVKVKAKKDTLEEQLRCKMVMEKLYSERLSMNKAELQRLKKHCEEMERKVNELDSAIGMRKVQAPPKKQLDKTVGTLVVLLGCLVCVVAFLIVNGGGSCGGKLRLK